MSNTTESCRPGLLPSLLLLLLLLGVGVKIPDRKPGIFIFDCLLASTWTLLLSGARDVASEELVHDEAAALFALEMEVKS